MGLFPILPHLVNVITIGAFTILSLLFLIASKDKLEKSKILIINSSLYITYLISLLYTSNFDYATKHLLTALSLAVLPLAFYFLNTAHFFSKNVLKKTFLNTFWMGSVVYSLVVYCSFFLYSNPRYPLKDANFFRKASTSIPLIDQHPIYSSIILSLAILIGLYYLLDSNKKYKFVVGLGQLSLLTLLFILMSKGVILALIASVFILLIFKLLNPFKFIYTILTGSLILVFLYVAIPQKNNRFSQLFNEKSYSNLNKNNSTSIRINIYKCAWTKIKDAPLFGYGFGDVKDELINCYTLKSSFMVKERYNSHNQYLSIWLSTGIFGLLIFCYALFYNLRLSFKADDYLGFSILLFFIVILFFENILERQTGVILFAFLLSLFGFYNADRLKK